MGDDIQEEAFLSQTVQFLHDCFQIRLRLEATFPKELVQIKDHLNEIKPNDIPFRDINFILFYRISHNLYRKSNLTMGELSSALSVQVSTATRMVDWMVKEGYAQRLPDPEDRRIVRVALTDTGRELHKAIESYMVQHLRQVLSCVTDEERTMLFNIMPKVMSALKKVTR